MLYLNHEQIMQVLSLEETMAAVERALALYEGGQFAMPDRQTISCGGDNVLIVMPCVAGGSMTAKILTLFPGNRAVNRPVIDGLVLLADQSNGEILCLADAKTITAMRTGAITGVSIRALAREGAASAGLVGCGAQGYYQLLYACAARPIRRIALFDRYEDAVRAMIGRLSAALPGVEIWAAPSPEALLRTSEVVITATTAREPVFPDDPALFEGRHFVAIGSFQPGVREYPDALWARTARVWVDTRYAMEESGELIIPLQRGLLREEQVETLGHQLQSGRAPERGTYGTTFFKTVGMALLDLTTARAAYERALQGGIGTRL
jgi:ornithine cyclodeaminase/alanine dehydrogenase-like protein (mu-crystallin family)